MSDYRRFIAYLYEYPNNRKGGCCGFVRVESQNGFCRMDFQIKSPSLPPETSVTVYGFIRRSGRMYGIPLGNLLAGRSSTSGKLFTHSDAIGQTDVTLDELGGLILLCCQTGVISFSLLALTMALSKDSEISSTASTETMKNTFSAPVVVCSVANPSQSPSARPSAVTKKAARK